MSNLRLLNETTISSSISSITITDLLAQGQATDGGNGRGFKQIGILSELTSITGLNFVFNDDNVDVGKIRTYGIRVDT
jgi:hypothetical protein